MRKHKIEDICWKEAVWQRPIKLETVWEVLAHLSALTPRGTVIWEARCRNGRVRYLLGADQRYIATAEGMTYSVNGALNPNPYSRGSSSGRRLG